MSPVRIRAATADDEPLLWRMLTFAASMEGGEDEVARAQADPDLRGYVDGFGRIGDRGVVAVRGTEPIGAAWLRLLHGEPHPAKVWTLEVPELAIALAPGARGQGVGSALLRALIADAADRYPALALSVRDGNAAVRLYERYGFVVERRLINRIGGVSLVMRRPLP